jgi:uncharacterized membrane protein YphA (DoxX/SURF4 family)
MRLEKSLDSLHSKVKQMYILQYFTSFNRIILAIAFIPSGMTKLIGNRFTQISTDNPIGLFFEGFYQTGFWYRFVGFAHIFAAILLLIPRTSTLGAVIFFPIVLNIAIITWSLNFQGTWVITSLMFLSNLYLICWDYDKIKPILPFNTARKTPFVLKKSLPIILVWAICAVLIFGFFTIINQSFSNLGIVGVIAAFAIGSVLGLLNSLQIHKK